MDQEKVFAVLKNSGWYEGRNIHETLKDSQLYHILPEKIQRFYDEFGGLTLCSYYGDKLSEKIVLSNDRFYDQVSYDYYIYRFKKEDIINYKNDNDDYYYYSTLVGTQLYRIADLKGHDPLMMDEYGNFYLIITDLPELTWYSNEALEMFNLILFGGEFLVLDEENMRWLPPLGKVLTYKPPVNSYFNKNPWGEQDASNEL